MSRWNLAAPAALIAALAAAGCGKSSFEQECKVTNKRTPITVKGVLLKPHADLLLTCDVKGKLFRAHEGTGRGCPLPMYPKEGGKRPAIEVFFPVGDKPGNLKPMPERFEWYKDVHVVTDDGTLAELGDLIEVTGELDTYYGACDLAKLTSVKLIEDRYGPTKKK